VGERSQTDENGQPHSGVGGSFPRNRAATPGRSRSLTSKTPGGRQPAMVATSASDRLRSGVASATPGSAGSDSRETAGTNECGSGLEGDQNPWKDRDVAPRKREPTSRTRRWSKASRPTGTTRVATHGSCAAGGLLSSPRATPGGSCGCRRTRQVWRRDGRRRSPPHRTRRERPRGRVRRGPVGTAAHSDPSFAAGFSAVRGGVRQPPSAVVAEGADQTAWRQRPQRCGAAADEDQTFEGSALRGSGPTPSPSGTEPSCHPPGNFGFRRLVDVKRSEPHVRYRDATSPDPAVRRKPSRW